MVLRRRTASFVLVVFLGCLVAAGGSTRYSSVSYRKLFAVRRQYKDAHHRIEDALSASTVVESFLTNLGSDMSLEPHLLAAQLAADVTGALSTNRPSAGLYSSCFLQTGPRSKDAHASEDQLDGQHFDPEDATAEPTLDCKQKVFGIVSGEPPEDPACMMGETNEQ